MHILMRSNQKMYAIYAKNPGRAAVLSIRVWKEAMVRETVTAAAKVATTLSGQETKVSAGMLELSVMVTVKFAMPGQDERLAGAIEEAISVAGQQLQLGLFEQAIAGADEELLKGRMAAGNLVRRGKKDYTFKTKFGEAIVGRNRVSARGGASEIAAHHVWRTPQGVCIRPGLRAAVCDLMVKTEG